MAEHPHHETFRWRRVEEVAQELEVSADPEVTHDFIAQRVEEAYFRLVLRNPSLIDEEAALVHHEHPRGDRCDGANIRLHDKSRDLVNGPVVRLVSLQGRLGALARLAATVAAAAAESGMPVGEFAIRTRLLDRGKGQVNGVGVP